MISEKVTAFLMEKGLGDRIISFPVSTATVAQAAAAIGTDGAHIAKSMAFYDKNDDTCILIVTSGDTKIDNALFKATFGQKARMMSHEDALAYTGHAVGGVCPFALPTDGSVKLFFDASLKRFDIVYPAAGTQDTVVRLTPDELCAACPEATFVSVCRPIETENGQ